MTEIIGEAGVNHNGNVSIAYQMIEAAAYARAGVVKFQTYIPDRLLHKGDPTYNILSKLTLKQREFVNLAKYCEQCEIEFMSTPGDLDSLMFLIEEVGVKRIKIGSDDLTYAPLVEAACKSGLPVIMSTGMATMEEIAKAACLFDRTKLTLLHCVSLYPCPLEKANLAAMNELRSLGFAVGYSDHTAGILGCVAAAALGASIIEKHFMLACNMNDAIDKDVSIDEWALSEMVRSIEDVLLMIGTGKKAPDQAELFASDTLRKSIDGKRAYVPQ